MEEEDCSICFCPLEDGGPTKFLACTHKFHVECVDPWIEKHGICPVCKIDLRHPPSDFGSSGHFSLDLFLERRGASSSTAVLDEDHMLALAMAASMDPSIDIDKILREHQQKQEAPHQWFYSDLPDEERRSMGGRIAYSHAHVIGGGARLGSFHVPAPHLRSHSITDGGHRLGDSDDDDVIIVDSHVDAKTHHHYEGDEDDYDDEENEYEVEEDHYDDDHNHNDDINWVKFPREISTIVEEKYIKSLHDHGSQHAIVTIHGQKYDMNFSLMTQKNMASNTIRQLKRVRV